MKAGRIKEILTRVDAEYGKLSLAAIHGMDLDQALERLCTLPGVGVKTVSVVLLFACGRDVCPVDTHVHRLVRRIGLVEEKASRDQAFFMLQECVPRGKGMSLHLNLIRHGRLVCKSRTPQCAICVLRPLCDFARSRATGQ